MSAPLAYAIFERLEKFLCPFCSGGFAGTWIASQCPHELHRLSHLGGLDPIWALKVALSSLTVWLMKQNLICKSKSFLFQERKREREREGPILTWENGAEIALPEYHKKESYFQVARMHDLYFKIKQWPIYLRLWVSAGWSSKREREEKWHNSKVYVWKWNCDYTPFQREREREIGKKMRKMNANNWMTNLYQSPWVTEIYEVMERGKTNGKNAECRKEKERNWSSRKERNTSTSFDEPQSKQRRYIIEEREATGHTEMR